MCSPRCTGSRRRLSCRAGTTSSDACLRLVHLSSVVVAELASVVGALQNRPELDSSPASAYERSRAHRGWGILLLLHVPPGLDDHPPRLQEVPAASDRGYADSPVGLTNGGNKARFPYNDCRHAHCCTRASAYAEAAVYLVGPSGTMSSPPRECWRVCGGRICG